MTNSPPNTPPTLLEMDRKRKNNERSASSKLGLKSIRLSMTASEALTFRTKATREGWDLVFSEASRRAEGGQGQTDLNGILSLIWIKPRPVKKPAKKHDQDIPGQTCFC